MAMYNYNLGMREVRSVVFSQFVFSEFFGTCILMFFGIVTYSSYGKQSLLLTSLCFGFATACLVKAFGHICCGMFNPAITLALMIGRSVNIVAGACAIIFQFIGATLGAALAYAVKTKEEKDMGVLSIPSNICTTKAIFFEAIATSIIAMVYLAVTDKRRIGYRDSAFIVIGLAVIAAHISIADFTGPALNPARAFATAAVNSDRSLSSTRWKFIWIHVAGPCLGGLLAAMTYSFLFTARNEHNCYPVDWF